MTTMNESENVALHLIRALKEQQTLVMAYKAILVSVMAATQTKPGLQGSLPQEVQLAQRAAHLVIDAEYLELERGLLDGNDVRP